MHHWVSWHWLWIAGVWALTIVVIVWAVAALFPGPPRRDAREVIDQRLARGELDVDEYRRLRDELATPPTTREHAP